MKRILVIGDGQLGLMLAATAARLGLVLDRLSPEAMLLYRGTARLAEQLPPGWDGAEYDVLTAEREHLPDNDAMRLLQGHPGFAAAGAIATIADRRTQKSLLDRLGLPTADWLAPRTSAEIARFLDAHGGSAIAKAARGGYDGRGQWRLDTARHDPGAAALRNGLIVERRVHFERELSLVGARFANGRHAFYPLVENHHAHGMLRATLAPATASTTQRLAAEEMLATIMDALDYVGVMALELFDENGELLINELAPRVHNSGHWTQSGVATDQFELHLRALCGLPCPTLAAAGRTVMLNLIDLEFDPRWLDQPNTYLHWYGKQRAPARKLGHLNLHARDCAELVHALEAMRSLVNEAHGDAIRQVLQRLNTETASSFASPHRLALARPCNRYAVHQR